MPAVCPAVGALPQPLNVKFKLTNSNIFAGLTVTKILRLFHHLGVPMISSSTHYNYTKDYTQPIISKIWSHQQQELITKLQGTV